MVPSRSGQETTRGVRLKYQATPMATVPENCNVEASVAGVVGVCALHQRESSHKDESSTHVTVKEGVCVIVCGGCMKGLQGSLVDMHV